MFSPANVRATIDSLHANVAVLDSDGRILEVNQRWVSFGQQRNALIGSVGLNYLQVCADASKRGDNTARRVEKGLRRLLCGQADSYGTVYVCAEKIFRMTARRLSQQGGGAVIAHQDITSLIEARRERDKSRKALAAAKFEHAVRVEIAHEELGQRLVAISLAAGALERGGNVADAVTLIKFAVEEARQELKLLRHKAWQGSQL